MKGVLKELSKKKKEKLPKSASDKKVILEYIFPLNGKFIEVIQVTDDNDALQDFFNLILRNIQNIGKKFTKIAKVTAEKFTVVAKVAAEKDGLQDVFNLILRNIQKIGKKFVEVAKITAENKVLRDFFNKIWRNIQKIGWKDRGFVGRAAVIGGIVGIILGGGGGVGMVVLGSGIEIPLFLATALSGAFVGLLIQGLKKEENS